MPRLPDMATTEELKTLEGSAYEHNRRRLRPKVFRRQQKLYVKAKREPRFRFYSLFGQLQLDDLLNDAWDRVAANNGAPGLDGVRIADLKADPEAVDRLLGGLKDDLRTKSYKPSPVKRVMIPKPGGKKRPLGIPTVRDRVLQMAVLLLVEPIFEADFLPCSFGFRPGKNAHGAVDAVKEAVGKGQRPEVLDADLASYFDTIPHDKLMACVQKRITDGSLLNLIRQWLNAPIVEDGGPPQGKKPSSGTPQGGVLSPLLANLYLHWLDKLFHAEGGPGHFANARLIRYADDFVIIAKYIGPQILDWVQHWIGRMGLTLNQRKTRTVRLATPERAVDFLGFSFRLEASHFGGRFCTVAPSEASVLRGMEKVKELTSSRWNCLPPSAVVRNLARVLRGWAAYYDYGYASRAMRDMDWFVLQRMRRHLGRRSQRGYQRPTGRSWYQHLHEDLGLVRLAGVPR